VARLNDEQEEGGFAMKNTLKKLILVGFLILAAGPSYAWVSVGCGFRGAHFGYRGHGFRVAVNPFWPVYAAPVYIQEPIYQQPVIVQQPVIQQPIVEQPTYPQTVVTTPAMIPDPEAMQTMFRLQNYGQLLSGFHARLTWERNILNRQLTKGGLNQNQYDRDKSTLDKITEDERKAAYDNGGSLSSAQINNLNLRMTQAEQQIQQDLAE
jgi:hypothetical protein